MKPPLGSIEIHGQAGPQKANDNDEAVIRLSKDAALIGQQLHGKYYLDQFNSYNAYSNVQMSNGLAQIYSGLLLYNPHNSGVILVLTTVKFALQTSVDTNLIGLIYAWHPVNAVISFPIPRISTNKCNLIGNGNQTPKGIATSAVSINLPAWLTFLTDSNIAPTYNNPTPIVYLDGLFGIRPGGFIALGCLGTPVSQNSFTWSEIPL